MKFSVAAALLSLSSAVVVDGFAVAPRATTVTTTKLFSTVRPDTSAAVSAAVAASKEFGSSSPEARLAWEVVEELDSADNSAAFAETGTEGCLLTEEEISQACLDYGEKVVELRGYAAEIFPKMEELKSVAADIKAIKMNVAKSKPGADSPELRAALETARATSEKKGPKSKEAQLAWETVEEIGSADYSNALGGTLDEECLLDSAQEACQALDELNKALTKEDKKGGAWWDELKKLFKF